MTPPNIVTRGTDAEQVFLCDRCGEVHRHSPGDGHRGAHCNGWPGGYVVTCDARLQPGLTSKEEITAMYAHVKRARHLLRGVATLLDVAELGDSEAGALVRKLADSPHFRALLDYGSRTTCALERLPSLDQPNGLVLAPG
jgi:hypothetical protein